MRLFLVQHGRAVSKDEDPKCPLSSEGMQDVANISAMLQRRNITINRIYHSEKLRAKMSAEILSQSVSEINPVEMSGLKPSDPVKPIIKQIAEWKDDTMLVGHLPFMSKLVNALLGVDFDGPVVAFKPGTIVCLEKTEDSGWVINWMLRPRLT